MHGGDLLRAVGLLPDGPAVFGRPTGASRPGVYVIELPAPVPAAPIDLARVGKWLERVPELRLDGERPTSRQLVARLGAFWLPGQTVLFVGAATGAVAGRLKALDLHVLGDPRPHAAGQWLKALRVDALRVWWAATDAPEEYEDALLDAFAAGVSETERATLPDTQVLPWANQRRSTGDRRRTGLTGATLPVERTAAPPPPHVVEVPPGDAEGVPEARNTGTVRRTNPAPPPVRSPRSATARTPRAPRAPAVPNAQPGTEPVHLTPDGHARMLAELAELTRVRRPQVIERIVRARELGDLKENADYTAAREEQSFLEGRIRALEQRLKHAVVVATPTDADRVVLGSKVTTRFLDEEVVFEIVGTTEADPTAGRISTASPVGRALLGRAVGDEAVVLTPRGEAHYRIVAIE